MKKLGTFQSAKWGNVIASQGNYDNAKGPIAIVLTTDNGEPLTTLSVNMYKPECSHDSKDLPAGCFYVKQWGGNQEVSKDALASGLFIERTDLPYASSGYVEAPVWQIAGSAS